MNTNIWHSISTWLHPISVTWAWPDTDPCDLTRTNHPPLSGSLIWAPISDTPTTLMKSVNCHCLPKEPGQVRDWLDKSMMSLVRFKNTLVQYNTYSTILILFIMMVWTVIRAYKMSEMDNWVYKEACTHMCRISVLKEYMIKG